ncbi:hydrocarbon degradation protein [Lutibacter profundi]|uniref:Hydrocarbon degradation protein n=1 Tax=Lutibacter profundi TaxID=1622118 RepID=A0A0X8G4Q1_9FLAO|nr:outer membrane protein transport protein [Lutibacter profundi]AMC10008.1 hydrocarbon degradation protein [Lutibacter profundi]
MRKLLRLVVVLFTTATFAQAGHIMQGVGAVNMSMGGASTAQPIDISGALQWNPASISVFDSKILDFNIGLFFSSPELSSSLPAGAMWPADAFGPGSPASPAVSGVTKDDRGASPMPAFAMVWGKEDSKHTFGVSAFGISGFGVTFPEETNLPMDANGNPNPNWDPNNSNPISYPQSLNGFGHIESDYMLLQVGFTWAYELSETFSIGIEPTFNYAALELAPNPTANPNASGYAVSDKASALGFGAQFGVFYNSPSGFKLGASYKTAQNFGDLEFNNTYLDGSTATNNFNMDYPAILSFGLGYSKGNIDFALDYRMVDYENTDGFAEKGWTQTGSVAGFGWKNINILSVGLQYKGIEKLPLRFGYTYSSNPIDSDVAFFSIPATAVIKNAFQFGFSYPMTDNLKLSGVYHYGTSGGDTKGQLLNPMLAQTNPPYGAIPGTEVSYKMDTSLIMFGISYTFAKK